MARLITPADLEELEASNPDYDVQLESLSQWQLAWKRFKKHRMALIGSILFFTMLGLGVIGPIIFPYDYYHIPKPDVIASAGRPPSLVPFRPFGETGQLQENVFILVVNGIRWSLLIGLLATAISAVLGTIVGGIAGYYGGLLDNVLMRFVDSLLALPLLFVILVFTRFLGAGNWFTIALIFGLLGWLGIARLVRSVILSLREEDYVDAARAAGISTLRIIFRHLLPNALSPIIVASTLSVAGVIIGEAFVSYLGYGVNRATPTLGNILTQSQNFVSIGNWWWALFPGMAIVIIVLGINFMGDGLQDALDPRAKI
jgi:peptide/nickel transport system permease protein